MYTHSTFMYMLEIAWEASSHGRSSSIRGICPLVTGLGRGLAAYA